MIRSMTGYGRCDVEAHERKVHVEISSVNHRYCDIAVRMPRTLAHLEETIKKCVKEKISRGKIEVNLYYTSASEDDIEVVVNEQLCGAYVKALRALGEKYKLQDNMSMTDMMSLGDVVTLQKKVGDEQNLSELVESSVQGALEELLAMREKEGEALKKDILEKSRGVLTIVQKVEEISYLVVKAYRTKLKERLEKLLDQVPVDEARLATEVAMFADRCAIDEELTRLKSHVKQLEHILIEGGSVGRKLDFLMQEMNREANTIASKANDYTITTYAVELKTEIEKIREQIQNIE